MSYRDFVFPDVADQLGLRHNEGRLFTDVHQLVLRPEFQETLELGRMMTEGANNEKSRAEFLLAPLLVEVRRILGKTAVVFSGAPLEVDEPRGLTGPCDFILAREPHPYVLTNPRVVLTAGRFGNRNRGLGPCIAMMRAAWLYRDATKEPVQHLFGVFTNGAEWRFFRLRDEEYTIDTDCYTTRDMGRILAILVHMATTA